MLENRWRESLDIQLSADTFYAYRRKIHLSRTFRIGLPWRWRLVKDIVMKNRWWWELWTRERWCGRRFFLGVWSSISVDIWRLNLRVCVAGAGGSRGLPWRCFRHPIEPKSGVTFGWGDWSGDATSIQWKIQELVEVSEISSYVVPYIY